MKKLLVTMFVFSALTTTALEANPFKTIKKKVSRFMKGASKRAEHAVHFAGHNLVKAYKQNQKLIEAGVAKIAKMAKNCAGDFEECTKRANKMAESMQQVTDAINDGDFFKVVG